MIFISWSGSGIFPKEDSSLDESGFFNSYSQQVIGNDAPDNTENANIVYVYNTHVFRNCNEIHVAITELSLSSINMWSTLRMGDKNWGFIFYIYMLNTVYIMSMLLILIKGMRGTNNCCIFTLVYHCYRISTSQEMSIRWGFTRDKISRCWHPRFDYLDHSGNKCISYIFSSSFNLVKPKKKSEKFEGLLLLLTIAAGSEC